MIYVALLVNNTVINTIVTDESDDISTMPERMGCDEAIDVTDMSPCPGPDWTHNNNEWRPPQPYPSWIWNGTQWVAPVPMPDEGGPWVWDEATQSWIEEATE